MKINSIRIALAVAVLTLQSLAAAPAGLAQTKGTINVPADEAKAYEPIEKAPTVAESIVAAKAFIEKYPQSAAIPQVEIAVYNKISDSPKDATRVSNIETFKQMFPTSDHGAELDRSMADYYLSQSNFAEVRRVGEAYLVKHADDVGTEVLLLEIGVEGAKRGDAALVRAGIDHGKKAIALLEGPTRPTAMADDAAWAQYKKDNLATAYQSFGILAVATNDTKTATDYLTKASAEKPTDPLNYLFLASVKEGEYEPLAKDYNGAIDKTSDKAKQKLEAVNAIVDQMIPLFAKAVVFSEGIAQYAQIGQSARESLEAFYKLRHDGKLDGLDAVIAAAKAAK